MSITKLFSLWALLLSVVFLTGCFTPKATVLTDQPLQRYKRVYIATANPDPRKVHPRIVTRLRNLGFDVREIGDDTGAFGGQGTGFVINTNGHVLSCAHVFGSNTAATVWLRGRRFEADVVSTDTNVDLALLQLRGPSGNFAGLPPLTIADAELRLGQTVFTMGFPLSDLLGKTPRLNKGLVSSTVGMEDDPQQYQISVEVQPGNSGGPLLTENGQVVGIVMATLNPFKVLLKTGGNLPQNVNFASKAAVLSRFVRTNGAPITVNSGETNSFERIQESLALIRAGIIPEGEENFPEMVCSYSYVSFWDVWFRFRVFHVAFFDLKTGKPLLRAGQYQDNLFSTEDAVMDRTFEEIRSKFAPTTGAAK